MIAPPDWLDPQRPYLIGISGGRDSVFLHHWLLEHDFHSLTYCHLNHGLRGQESDEDEAFLQDLLGKRLISETVDVAKIATSTNISVETAARKARHCFFARCAVETGTSEILLAHHAEDQAETILFNLLRGSAGLKGMTACQEIGELTFLRPILGVRREDIDSFLETRNLRFREDSSNKLPFATRNRLRHEALPLLREILARDPVPALVRALEHSAELEEIADHALNQLQLEDPQGRLYLPKLRELPMPLQRRAVFQYLKARGIPDISTALIDQSLTLLPPGAPPALPLPGGQRLRRKESRLFISA